MESQNVDNVFVPQVSVNLIPEVGQEFESHEDAFNFYNEYARAAGFSTRIANCKKRKETNETYWKLFVCYKEGKTNEAYQLRYKNVMPRVGERNRGHTRVGCNARLAVVKQQTGDMWVVNKFVDEHNHGLTTPSRVHLLRSHRNVSATKKALTQQFSEANIPTCQQLRLLEIDSGGPSSVGFGERDIRNHERNMRQEQKGHDAEALIEHFQSEQQKNPNFYFAYETDLENKLVRCLWADCESRRSYAFFGDAVVFDTTYNTNKYAMIFAPFVGVNHYKQTIIFGFGLLSDETTDSFVWLFSKFFEAMPTRSFPQVIITDQDAAISKAISMVLPNTLHRYCIWHILNKFSEKINAMLYNEQYHNLVNIIKQSESPEEFERRWSEVMETTNLSCNEWLSNMYEIRSRWVPAYVKHVFSAGMSSSQRSESGHSFLKKYIIRKNSLMEFISRLNRALDHQRHEELVANHIDLIEQPRLTSIGMIENQLVRIYTKKIFLLFQKELEQSNFYICSKKSNSSEGKVYSVERFEPGKTFDRARELIYYPVTDLITCSCHMFEFDGYPCRHMLSYLKKKQVLLLPDQYILRRWTKNAKVGSIFESTSSLSVHDGSGHSLMARHGMLAHKASLLVDDGSLTDARSTFLLDEFQNLHIRLKEIDNEGSRGISTNRSKSREQCQVVCDPNIVRAKGCGKRLKSSKEKAISQCSRQCRVCGATGHDKRTCPSLRDRCNVEKQNSQYDYEDLDNEGRFNERFTYEASSNDYVQGWNF